MKVLIIGLGSIGQRHLRNLKVLGVQDFLAWRIRNRPLPEPLEGCLKVYSSLSQALESKPHVVFICNPPSFHVPIAIQAAKAGCHLFIEKPLSNSWDGVDELLSLVREKKLITMVGFNLRFHPGMQLVKSLLEEKKIGRVVNVRAQVGQYLPDWHPSEDYRGTYSASRDLGGGVILDLIHELDYTRWLVDEVSEVLCFAGRLSSLEIETEDMAEILLRFKNGVIGNVHMDYVQRSPSRTCQITGEEGTIVWDYYANEVRLFQSHQPKWQVFRQEGFERNDMYLAEIAHFLACLEGREKPVVDAEDGAKVLRLALSARESAETGKMCDL